MNDIERVQMKIDATKWLQLCDLCGVNADTEPAALAGILRIRQTQTLDGLTLWEVSDLRTPNACFRVHAQLHAYSCNCPTFAAGDGCAHGEAVMQALYAPQVDDSYWRDIAGALGA